MLNGRMIYGHRKVNAMISKQLSMGAQMDKAAKRRRA